MTIETRTFLGPMTEAECSQGRFMRAPDEHPGAPVVVTPAADPAPLSFDDAFKAETTPTPADPPKPTAPAEPAVPAEPAAPAEEPKPEAPAEPAAETPKPVVPTVDEIVRGLADKLTPPAAPAAPAAPAPAEQPSLYNEDEQKVLTDYASNWPDVQRAEQLTRRAEYHDLLAYVFKEVNKHTAPLFDQVRTMGNTLHTGELKTLVPDYSPTIESDVNTWIDTQPGYLQAAYKHVMQSGTSEEVADLIGRYRVASGASPAPAPASGTPAAPAAPAPAPAAAKPGTPAASAKTELSEAAKQAVASLAPVGGERTQVPAGEDQQDFSSAFAKYAATEKM